MSSATPNFSSAGLHNNSANNQPGMNETLPEHWAQQLQLAAEARQNQAPHHHAKKEGVVSLAKTAQQSVEESYADDGEERNRPMSNGNALRQNWNTLDMSGQGLHSVAAPLFDNYAFLTRLYLDNNNLLYLSTAIGQLRSLVHLNVSQNKLIQIPPEIGMLSNLREFLLFDNQIRELPIEIGLLHRLELLGIDGNTQLDENQRAMMIEQGTKALVTHLRETSQGTRFSLAMVFRNVLYIEFTRILICYKPVLHHNLALGTYSMTPRLPRYYLSCLTTSSATSMLPVVNTATRLLRLSTGSTAPSSYWTKSRTITPTLFAYKKSTRRTSRSSSVVNSPSMIIRATFLRRLGPRL